MFDLRFLKKLTGKEWNSNKLFKITTKKAHGPYAPNHA